MTVESDVVLDLDTFTGQVFQKIVQADTLYISCNVLEIHLLILFVASPLLGQNKPLHFVNVRLRILTRPRSLKSCSHRDLQRKIANGGVGVNLQVANGLLEKRHCWRKQRLLKLSNCVLLYCIEIH